MAMQFQQLTISSWNVRCLGDKIEDPRFLENLTSDINILLETWKGDSDQYKVISYNCISKARTKKKKARRHSGGIIIYFKKEFTKGITYLKEVTLSQNRLLLKLDKMFFGLSQDVYLCAVYIPPISSPHYDNDFISLEGEVSTFSSKGKIVLQCNWRF